MTETPTSPTPNPTPSPAPRRKGRGLKIALGLSLTFNMLVVGIVAGAVWGKIGRPPTEADGPLALRTLGLGPVIFAMEREDRAALRDRIEADRHRLHPAIRGLGGSLQQAIDAIRAEPFDRGAVSAALAGSRQQIEALQSGGHELLLDQLEVMSPEARAALADRMERRLRHGSRDRHRPGD